MKHPPPNKIPYPCMDKGAVGVSVSDIHVRELIELKAGIDFVEVIAENHFHTHAPAFQGLQRLREMYPVSLHCVGLSLGSACGVDRGHLKLISDLIQRIEPSLVSDHASFSRADAFEKGNGGFLYSPDLLPVGLNQASLGIMSANISLAQDVLRRRILVENISSYVSYDDDSMSESEFIRSVCITSGCGILLDVTNIVINGLNSARRQDVWIDLKPLERFTFERDFALQHANSFFMGLPRDMVGEIHLSGFRMPMNQFEPVIDEHGERVSKVVWQAYRNALVILERVVPTVIEWETREPSLQQIMRESDKLRTLLTCPVNRPGFPSPT